MPAPFIFLLVMGATIMLIIFFGAWAVATDIEGRELTFGLTGSAPGDTAAPNDNTGAPAAFGAAPIGETAAPNDGAAGTWWGRGFLKACPLH